MPFLRSPNGSKVKFSQARLSALLSLVYQDVYGDKTPRYRVAIQKHCMRVWNELCEVYGNEEADEWDGQGIYRRIEEELKSHGDVEVHESFLSMHISEFQESKPKKQTPWDRFEAQANQASPKKNPFTTPEQIDPLWAIVLPFRENGAEHAGTENFESEPLGFGSTLGLGLTSQDTDKKQNTEENIADEQKKVFSISERIGFSITPPKLGAKKRATEVIAVKRSDWMGFWRTIARRNPRIPWGVWDKHIAVYGLDQRHLTIDDWWSFWQIAIDECMQKDPRVHELRRVLHERQKRGIIMGQTWCEGTEVWPQDRPFKMEFNPTGNVWYRRLAIEHLQHIFGAGSAQEKLSDAEIFFGAKPEENTNIPWDWGLISKSIKPERDEKINWRAWQYFEDAGALWPLSKQWKSGETPADNAKEMPQWAMMRVAMAMAVIDGDMTHINQNTIELYDHISRQLLMPGAAIFRDAGRDNTRFFDDTSWLVQDNFSQIQDVVHKTATETLWTGTAASAWSNVRSKNALVRDGRRRSTGVNDFLRILNAQMLAQGRVGEDRPVTTSLPCWHLDIEEFISMRHEDGQRLQITLLINDVFMQRLAEHGKWTLFDPSVYPEILDPQKGYHFAENCIEDRKKLYPQAHRIVSAEKLWKKILASAREGSPFVVFEDCDKSYSIAEKTNLIHGLDGVGSFPLLANEKSDQNIRIEWPALAVNIGEMMSSEGEPLLDQWRETITWAFWMAEQIYKKSHDQITKHTKNIRPLCLGAVGFYEAVRKASLAGGAASEDVDIWVGKISEAWGALVTMVDQVFCQKYGPAPAWETDNSLQTFHPKINHERLKKQRKGGVGVAPPPEQISNLYDEIHEHRFSVRTLWAPFKQLASWAGVSPGGFGTLYPIEWVLDETRTWRLTPTNFFLDELKTSKNPEEMAMVFVYPETPSKWPSYIRKMAMPDAEEWKRRLKHASVVRIWVDQGVSLTLPTGVNPGQLSLLLQQAWWHGISNVRFEDGLRKPEGFLKQKTTEPPEWS